MSEFTKGPWVVSEICLSEINGEGSISIRNKSKEDYEFGRWIADAKGTHVGPHNVNEVKANAHLIAAGPDMYDFIESITDINGPYPELHKTEIVGDAYDILRKARGMS